jgi:uncharacterized membrane protein
MKEEALGSEIKKEFQLERMILFSDAVFAIVITLMAIEIRIPEPHIRTNEGFIRGMMHIIPTILAYILSFFFIGIIWIRHLKIFSFLKDYDRGLIILNLILLFFVGLFPFAAALITGFLGLPGPWLVYFSIILGCLLSQIMLQHYIFKMRPNLRIDVSLEKELRNLKIMKINFTGLVVVLVLVYITYINITDPKQKLYAFIWLYIYVLIIRLISRYIKKKNPIPQAVH